MNPPWGPDFYQQGNMGMQPPLPLMQNPMAMPPMGMGMMDSGPPGPMIGPMKPPDMSSGNDVLDADDGGQSDYRRGQRNKDRSRDSRRDRERSRHQGSDSSYDRRNDDRNNRNDNRFNNNERRRDRPSKWDNDKERPALLPAPGQPPLPPGQPPLPPGPVPPGPMPSAPGPMPSAPGPMQPMGPGPLQPPPPLPMNGPPANMMPGMMPYNNMNMVGTNMDMQNMGNMPNMMMGMPGAMPAMPNMVDQNQMMMMNMMMMQQQALYISNAVLLPPLPGASLPKRRERPENCRTIFVGGLPEGATEETVREIFGKFGNLSEIKHHREGIYHVRFESPDNLESVFILSGYRFRFNNQMDNEATTVFIDYALNREDQLDGRKKRHREPTPPRSEPYNSQNLQALIEKIKSDENFYESALTLVAWMERGECNKKNANTFYTLIQASNGHTRRLLCEKMTLDEEYQNLRNSFKPKFQKVVVQLEQVEKILTAAKHQRVSDHFTKQQRRNIEMWLKMSEEVENIKEEFNANFNDEEQEKPGKDLVASLKSENEKLLQELEAYKNEANLTKNEADMKIEKFKAQIIAQQAMHGGNPPVFPPLPPPPMSQYPAQSKQEHQDTKFSKLAASEGKLISILTAFLLVHPLGASLDYLVSYVRSMIPNASQEMVNEVLTKFPDLFSRKVSGIGASIGHTWAFVMFDKIKGEK